MKYVVVEADGDVEALHRQAGLDMQDIQALVGGRYPRVTIIPTSGYSLLSNAEAEAMGMPRNTFWPFETGECWPFPARHCGDSIVGRTDGGEICRLAG